MDRARVVDLARDPAFLEVLTDRQRTVVRLFFEPREDGGRRDAAGLARGLGISRQAFQDHLDLALRKLAAFARELEDVDLEELLGEEPSPLGGKGGARRPASGAEGGRPSPFPRSARATLLEAAPGNRRVHARAATGPRIPVVAYLWLEGGQTVAEVPAEEYWPPQGTRTPDGSRYVLRGESHAHLGKPTHERVEGGAVLPMRRGEANPEFRRTRIVGA